MKEQQLRPVLDLLSRHPARLEALVADLVGRGLVDVSEVELHPVSTFARNYSREVETVGIREYDAQSALQLSAHREGLYDQLPYGLFHRPEPYVPGQHLKARLEESRVAREREAAARQFFSPFEQEFFRVMVNIERTEGRLVDAFTSPLRRELLLEIWSHCTRVPAHSLPLLSYVLPLAYRIAGDLPLMAACYQAVLLAPVELRYATPHNDESAPPAPASGDRLGVDLTLGGMPAAELPVLELHLGPLERERCAEFLPGGPGAELLQLLNDCLVPYEVEINCHYRFAVGAGTLTLGRGDALDSRLGFTSRLARRA